MSTRNLIGQEQWERRGENDARIRALETKLALIDTGASTDYTPALTASVSNPTGSGGSVEGGYTRQGQQIKGWAIVVFGTSGVGAGSGNYRISLPVAPVPATAGKERPIGSGFLLDSNLGTIRLCLPFVTTTGTYAELLYDNATTQVTNAAPWTWAASDRLHITFDYPAAS